MTTPSGSHSNSKRSSTVNSTKPAQSASRSTRTETKPKKENGGASSSTHTVTDSRTKIKTDGGTAKPKSKTKRRSKKLRNRARARQELIRHQERLLAEGRGREIVKAGWQLTKQERAEKRETKRERHRRRADEIRKTDPTYESRQERSWRLAEERRQRRIEKRTKGEANKEESRQTVEEEDSSRPGETSIGAISLSSSSSYSDSGSSDSDYVMSSEIPEDLEEVEIPPNHSPRKRSAAPKDSTPPPLVPTPFCSKPEIDPTNMSGFVGSEARPSTSLRLYHVHYPAGGVSYDSDGNGIWYDEEAEDGLQIWVDPALTDRRSLISKIESEGGQISPDHTEPTTQILLLSPASTYVFDRYCHPEWLAASDLRRYRKRRRLSQPEVAEEEEPWQSKVILKAWWVDECVKVGRFLGEKDRWAGCRVGGPPKQVMTTSDGMADQSEGAVEDGGIGDETQAGDDDDKAGESGADPSENQAQSTVGTHDEPMDIDGDEGQAPAQDSFVAVVESTHEPTVELDVIDIPDEEESVAGLDPSPIHLASNVYVDHEATEEGIWSAQRPVDETAESSTSRSLTSPILHPAEPDSNKMSSDPATLFSGLKFWVDPAYGDRLSLIRQLRGAGGEIVAEYREATHVLIWNYKPAEWQSIVHSIKVTGVWQLNLKWASKSLEAGRLLDEAEYCVPGGNPNQDTDQPKGSQRPGAHTEPYMSAVELDAIFTTEEKLWGGKAGFGNHLHSNYGVYSVGRWQTLYRRWRQKEGRFAYLPAVSAEDQTRRTTKSPLSNSRPSTFTEPNKSPAKSIVEDKSPINSSQTITQILETERKTTLHDSTEQEMATILGEKYPMHAKGAWRQLCHEWFSKTGRYTRSVESDRLSPQKKSSSTQAPKVTKSNAGRERYSLEGLCLIFMKEHKRLTEDRVSAADIGFYLAEVYETYSQNTWIVYYQQWRSATGKFAGQDKIVSPDVSVGAAPDPTPKGQVSPKAPSKKVPKLKKASDTEVKRLSTEELAKLFEERKEEFESRKLTPVEVGLEMTEKVGVYSRKKWACRWNDWRNGEGRFRVVKPPDTRTTGSVIDQKELQGRSAPRMKVRQFPRWTEEERLAMATYVLDKGMDSKYHRPEEWEDFAKMHPSRTAAAYALQYTNKKTRMRQLMAQIHAERKTILDAKQKHSSTVPVVVDDSEGGDYDHCIDITSDNND
ncbi:hypothetical protein IAR55_005033 [Kwoniella newhampshirensis]|uniref:BRCT domain-containing protein n=1 Tax=Kwoniella newhampshirensis TaxID=1651941 RepID=A0AAW0YUS3_9TREE